MIDLTGEQFGELVEDIPGQLQGSKRRAGKVLGFKATAKRLRKVKDVPCRKVSQYFDSPFKRSRVELARSGLDHKQAERAEDCVGEPQSGRGSVGGDAKPSVEETLEKLRRRVGTKGQIVHVETISGRVAAFGEPDVDIPAKVKGALRDSGIPRLYNHQAAAVSAVLNGASIVAATPTASGKSLTYTIPIMEAIHNLPRARALLIFPLKALARDQLKAMRLYLEKVKQNVQCDSFDGDTPAEERPRIRRSSQVVFTNPDMLHHGILPFHKGWAQFFKNLQYVVVDEAHYYRGVFGSHVGCLLRRLLRVAAHYGMAPQFICCSATIANPQEHVERLISAAEGTVDVIDGCGAPSGPKHIVCWQPPLADDHSDDNKRRSAYQEAADIIAELVKAGLQTLVFVPARKLTEIVCNYTREVLEMQQRWDLSDLVGSYRAGYTASERRELEKRLANGELRALVSTNALELGIDVGALDATVHVGMPDTMCSFWQQVGRAGRRQGACLAVLVAQERPADQHYMNNPQQLFTRKVENALCDPSNENVLRLHLRCAANELPLVDKDRRLFGSAFAAVRDDLALTAELVYQEGPEGDPQYRYRWDDNPSQKFSLRGILGEVYEVVGEDGGVIEEIEGVMAFKRVHPGAIFLHLRQSYQVVHLDIEARRAIVRPDNSTHVTEAVEKVEVRIVSLPEEQRTRATGATTLTYGKVQVVERVTGFNKRHLLTDKIVLEESLNLPPREFDTYGVWWSVPEEVVQGMGNDDVLYDALVAVKKITTQLLPSFTMCDRGDVSGLAIVRNGELGSQIFVFDCYPGGIGVTEKAFTLMEEVWRNAHDILASCPCFNGCPSCIQPARHEKEAAPVKLGCKLLLQGLLRPPQTSANPPQAPLASSSVPLEPSSIIPPEPPSRVPLGLWETPEPPSRVPLEPPLWEPPEPPSRVPLEPPSWEPPEPLGGLTHESYGGLELRRGVTEIAEARRELGRSGCSSPKPSVLQAGEAREALMESSDKVLRRDGVGGKGSVVKTGGSKLLRRDSSSSEDTVVLEAWPVGVTPGGSKRRQMKGEYAEGSHVNSLSLKQCESENVGCATKRLSGAALCKRSGDGGTPSSRFRPIGGSNFSEDGVKVGFEKRRSWGGNLGENKLVGQGASPLRTLAGKIGAVAESNKENIVIYDPDH